MIEVRSPMVAMVAEVLVSVGDSVAEEDELIILESMKMQIPVTAPSAGRISDIKVAQGESVQEEDLLLMLE